MGNVRKIRNRIQRQSQVVDTNIGFGGHKIFVAISDGQNPNTVGKAFGEFMKLLINRAKQVNMSDLYSAHLGILEKIKKGEGLN